MFVLKWTYLQNRNRLTDIENRLVVAKGEGCREGMDWEFRFSRCKLLHIEWINNREPYSISEINHNRKEYLKIYIYAASLVAQWLWIRLPMQGTRVQALVQEDPTCRGATKPVRHNYWACTLEPVSHNYWARVPQLLKPTHLEPVLRNKRSHCNEKPVHCNKEQPLLTSTRERPCAATKTQCSEK